MRERLERSLGAVLVARDGREECDRLDRLLADWDGTFSVLWRKRVARHIDTCEVCERRRKAVPAVLLGGTAAAAPLLGAGSVSAAPAGLRERVLREAVVGTDSPPWSDDGFPPADPDPGRPALVVAVAALAAVALLIAATGGWMALRNDPEQIGAVGRPVTTSAVTPLSTIPPATSSTTTTAAPTDPPATETAPPVLVPPAPQPVPPDPGLRDPEPTNPRAAAGRMAQRTQHHVPPVTGCAGVCAKRTVRGECADRRCGRAAVVERGHISVDPHAA